MNALLIALTVIALAISALQTRAQDFSSEAFWHGKREVHRPVVRHRPKPRHVERVTPTDNTRVYGYTQEAAVRPTYEFGTDRGQCAPYKVKGIGEQWATIDGAKSEAEKAWTQSVRWMLGEKAMDSKNAVETTYTCGRSSIGSIAGQTMHRCEMMARPCEPVAEGSR